MLVTHIKRIGRLKSTKCVEFILVLSLHATSRLSLVHCNPLKLAQMSKEVRLERVAQFQQNVLVTRIAEFGLDRCNAFLKRRRFLFRSLHTTEAIAVNEPGTNGSIIQHNRSLVRVVQPVKEQAELVTKRPVNRAFSEGSDGGLLELCRSLKQIIISNECSAICCAALCCENFLQLLKATKLRR